MFIKKNDLIQRGKKYNFIKFIFFILKKFQKCIFFAITISK